MRFSVFSPFFFFFFTEASPQPINKVRLIILRTKLFSELYSPLFTPPDNKVSLKGHCSVYMCLPPIRPSALLSWYL